MRSHSIKQVVVITAAVILFAAAVIWFVLALDNTGSAAEEQRLGAVERTINDAVTLCYSIEGVYPQSLDYLTENYGITYDTKRYIVHYECFAANIRPVVRVVEKG